MNPFMAVIVCTGHGSIENAVEAMKEGASDYLLKPLQYDWVTQRLRAAVERILARRLHARRQVARFLPKQLAKTNPDGTVEEVDLIHKLFTDIAPRYLARAKENKGGGYTRVVKVNHRRGDNAPMSLIEFLD